MSGIAERYARAISSSHLEWSREEQTALDVIMAAGMSFRDHDGNIVEDGLGTLLMRLRFEFDSIAHMLGARNMLTRLKSAGQVRLRLIALIQDRGGQPCEAIEMAARLMDQWCDPSCPACSGRGTTGVYGEPQLICGGCSGSKRRTLLWSQEEQALADRIAADMEDKVDSAQRRIRKLLRQDA